MKIDSPKLKNLPTGVSQGGLTASRSGKEARDGLGVVLPNWGRGEGLIHPSILASAVSLDPGGGGPASFMLQQHSIVQACASLKKSLEPPSGCVLCS